MDIDEGGSKSKSFIKHVFNFEDEGKAEFLNVIQFSLLSIIPVVILNKAMQKFVPEADEQKGSFEILAEVVIQIVVMFVGLIFIDRIVTFVPTYSGIRYPEHSILFIIAATLMIILSLQTKLGDKVGILVDRVMELWEGKRGVDNKNKQGSGTIKVSQPISQNQNQMAMRETFTDGTSIGSLPTASPKEELPDYNKMYGGKQTPLVGASTPGQNDPYAQQQQMMGPIAANEALGGGFGGASW